jgi:hypothetical protein
LFALGDKTGIEGQQFILSKFLVWDKLQSAAISLADPQMENLNFNSYRATNLFLGLWGI